MPCAGGSSWKTVSAAGIAISTGNKSDDWTWGASYPPDSTHEHTECSGQVGDESDSEPVCMQCAADADAHSSWQRTEQASHKAITTSVAIARMRVTG